MKQIIKYSILGSCLFVLMGLMVSCKKDNTNAPDQKPKTAMSIEQSEITIAKNESTEIKINGGSGDFSVSLMKAGMATAEVYGDMIHVNAKQSGEQKLILCDNVTKQKIDIKLIVTDKVRLRIEPNEILLYAGTYKVVSVFDGSGQYTYEVKDNKVAEIFEDNGSKITLKGVGYGSTTMIVTDTGNKVSMEIPVTVSPRDLKIEEKTLDLRYENTKVIKILSGNGKYDVKVADPDMLDVSADEYTVTVQAKRKSGETTLTITDVLSAQEHVIKVSVTPQDLVLSENSIDIPLLQVSTVNILEGNGEYMINTLEGAEFIDVILDGAKIMITSKKIGKAKVEVTDKLTNQKVVISINSRELIMQINLSHKELTLKVGETIKIKLLDSWLNFWNYSFESNESVNVKIVQEWPPRVANITGVKEGTSLLVIRRSWGPIVAEIPVTVLP